jgi:hypothetical protein
MTVVVILCRLNLASLLKSKNNKGKRYPRWMAQGQGGRMNNVVELDKLEQLEFLLKQSLKGIHLLFDNKDIARVLSRVQDKDNKPFSMEKLKEMQTLLTDFIAEESLEDKRDFLEELDESDYELLVHTYFNLLENSIKEEKIVH